MPDVGIGPEIGRDLLRRAQADIDVAGDRVGVEPELRRPRAVDVGIERRRVDFLLQMRVGDPGMAAMRRRSSLATRRLLARS